MPPTRSAPTPSSSTSRASCSPPKRRSEAATAALALAALAPPAAQAGDSAQVWRTLRTPHFAVHYHEPLGEAAQALARRAERARALLTPLLGHAPDTTHVVLVDDTDSANGLAQVLPYNRIVLLMSAPDGRSELGDFDDWLYDLVVHEFAHVVHLDTIHGWPRGYNAVFGKTLSFNQAQPGFFIEGLATYQESARSSAGRLRSSLTRMMLRVAALDGTLQRIDQVAAGGSGRGPFPHGSIRYLYGAHFLAYLADRHGEAALARLSHDYAARALPWALNRSALAQLGASYLTLYDEFAADLARRARVEADEIAARGATPTRRLTHAGESCGSPRFSPDGRIFFYQSDGRRRAALRAVAPDGGPVQDLVELHSSATPAPAGDGHVVYDQRDRWRTFYSFGDLYRRAPDGAVARLTWGARARDPDVAPDGRRVAYAFLAGGSSGLAVIDLADADPGAGAAGAAPPRTLVAAEGFAQVYTPAWSPDGRTIAYSGWSPGGYRDLVLLDVASGARRALWRDRALDVDPRFSPDGRHLYFASDRTGVFNVHVVELATGQVHQVTNVVGGAFEPAVSPDGRTLAFIGYSSAGFDLHALALDPARWLAAAPAVDTRPPPPEIRDRTVYPVRGYRAVRTFYPRSWELDFDALARRHLVSARSDFADVLGRHAAAVRVSRVLEEQGSTSAGASYANDVWWPRLEVAGAAGRSRRGGFVLGGVRRSYREDRRALSLRAGLPLVRRAAHRGDLVVSYGLDSFRNVDEDRYRPDPAVPAPVFPDTGELAGVTLAMVYDNRQGYGYSLGEPDGMRVAVALSANHPAFGGDYHSTDASYSLARGLAPPWRRDHLLTLRAGGGISGGGPRERGVFAVGGLPDQDLIDAIVNLRVVGGGYLRGYPPGAFAGSQYHLLGSEYRFPLRPVERGPWTLPLFFRDLHAAVFADWGHAFFGRVDPRAFKLGLGAELRLELLAYHAIPMSLRAGYARGVHAGGIDDVYLLVGGSF